MTFLLRPARAGGLGALRLRLGIHGRECGPRSQDARPQPLWPGLGLPPRFSISVTLPWPALPHPPGAGMRGFELQTASADCKHLGAGGWGSPGPPLPGPAGRHGMPSGLPFPACGEQGVICGGLLWSRHPFSPGSSPGQTAGPPRPSAPGHAALATGWSFVRQTLMAPQDRGPAAPAAFCPQPARGVCATRPWLRTGGRWLQFHSSCPRLRGLQWPGSLGPDGPPQTSLLRA